MGIIIIIIFFYLAKAFTLFSPEHFEGEKYFGLV